MASNNKKEEPNTAPQPDRWFNLTLGSSFKDHYPSSKFCTLRYEFKPASIDKNQAGLLHKSKENRITVEFHNNQPGKSKVTFEGSSEDYKENDAVLFFDGESFRLERLHRAVKRLRHVRPPGESAAAAAGTSLGPAVEATSPPTSKVAKVQTLNKSIPHSMPIRKSHITSKFWGKCLNLRKTKLPMGTNRVLSVFPQSVLATDPTSKVVVSAPTSGSVSEIDMQVTNTSGTLVLHWGGIQNGKDLWIMSLHSSETAQNKKLIAHGLKIL